MIDLSQDIHSLSDFKRKTTTFTARMKKSGTSGGIDHQREGRLVVQDAASYQATSRTRRAGGDDGIPTRKPRGRGGRRTEPAVKALERLAKKHKLNRKAE